MNENILKSIHPSTKSSHSLLCVKSKRYVLQQFEVFFCNKILWMHKQVLISCQGNFHFDDRIGLPCGLLVLFSDQGGDTGSRSLSWAKASAW